MNTNTVSHRLSIRTLVAGLAMAGTSLLSSGADAGPVEEVHQECIASAPGSADAKERWADGCDEVARTFEQAYHDCMLGAAGTADSLERWVDHCDDRATSAVQGA